MSVFARSRSRQRKLNQRLADEKPSRWFRHAIEREAESNGSKPPSPSSGGEPGRDGRPHGSVPDRDRLAIASTAAEFRSKRSTGNAYAASQCVRPVGVPLSLRSDSVCRPVLWRRSVYGPSIRVMLQRLSASPRFHALPHEVEVVVDTMLESNLANRSGDRRDF